jgi:hypothetical protein
MFANPLAPVVDTAIAHPWPVVLGLAAVASTGWLVQTTRRRDGAATANEVTVGNPIVAVEASDPADRGGRGPSRRFGRISARPAARQNQKRVMVEAAAANRESEGKLT